MAFFRKYDNCFGPPTSGPINQQYHTNNQTNPLNQQYQTVPLSAQLALQQCPSPQNVLQMQAQYPIQYQQQYNTPFMYEQTPYGPQLNMISQQQKITPQRPHKVSKKAVKMIVAQPEGTETDQEENTLTVNTIDIFTDPHSSEYLN